MLRLEGAAKHVGGGIFPPPPPESSYAISLRVGALPRPALLSDHVFLAIRLILPRYAGPYRSRYFFTHTLRAVFSLLM